MYRILTLIFLLAFSLHVKPEAYIKVVDVGSGLCVIGVDLNSVQYFLYDTGHWRNKVCVDELKKINKNRKISLLVLSHSDSDHIGNMYDIEKSFFIDSIVHTGYQRPNIKTWKKANYAISNAAALGSNVYDLSKLTSLPKQKNVGAFTIDFIHGYSQSPYEGLSEAERRNAISIVVKITVGNHSVLLGGDIIGKKANDNKCLFSEKAIIDSGQDIKSDVLISPHHGADNASSECFLKRVGAKYIIFSSGHAHRHPREVVAKRTQSILNIPEARLFRTDRGDDEGYLEWDYLRIPNCKDQAGDDSIIINFDYNSPVFYENAVNSC